ncbi:MAG TPA: tetratricopeptide repeat protein [bacterium]|nr:tetratricopeptide repeat protein [bacterium]
MEINVTPESTGNVIEAGDQDFEAKVLERSNQVPVLVDFWAPWCGPCKVIGPVLEKVAKQWGGRFELVKVNVDESPMLAQALRIQSIPAVKLFINGRIQDEFMGAYPEPEVVRFLEHNLPSEQVDDAVAGLQLWQQGDHAGAMHIFDTVLAQDPKNAAALIGRGHCLMDQGDLDGAKDAVANVNAVDLEKLTDRQQLEKLLAILHGRIYLTEAAEADDSAQGEVAAKFTGACQAALTGQFERALTDLLDIVRTDRKFKDDAGRKAMLAVFDMLPPDSPLLLSFRQKLSNLLFA